MQPAAQQFAEFARLQQNVGLEQAFVGNRVAHRLARVDLQRRIERGDPFVQRHDAAHVVYRPVDQVGNLIEPDFASAGRFEVADRAQNEVDFLDHMHRQANGARLVHDRALDALPDPPGGVGGETEAALGVVFLDGVDQAEIAFLDQVEERHPAVQVMLGDVDHEPQVVLDHLLSRGKVPGPRAARPVRLFFLRKQRLGANFTEVVLGDVVEQLSFRRRRSLFEKRISEDSFVREIGFREVVDRRVRFGIEIARHAQRCGRCLIGSTGLPCRRTSKWSLT